MGRTTTGRRGARLALGIDANTNATRTPAVVSFLLSLSGVVHALVFAGVSLLALLIEAGFDGGQLGISAVTVIVFGMPVLGFLQAIWARHGSLRLVVLALVIAGIDVLIAVEFREVAETVSAIASGFAVVQCALAIFAFPRREQPQTISDVGGDGDQFAQ